MRERKEEKTHSKRDPHFACTLLPVSAAAALPSLSLEAENPYSTSLKISLEAETRARTRVKNILSSLLPVSLSDGLLLLRLRQGIRRRQTCSPLSLSHPTLLIISSPEISV